MASDYHSKSPIYLLPDERIILKTNPHWLFLVIPIMGIFFFFLLYLFFICPFLGILFHSIEGFCYIISFFILFFLSIVFFLDWKFNRLYLTNFRLIKERGIIGKRYMAIRLKDIEDIFCSFGIWGRIFGYGSLIIESAGTYGKMVFQGIPKPRIIKLRIEREMFFSELK